MAFMSQLRYIYFCSLTEHPEGASHQPVWWSSGGQNCFWTGLYLNYVWWSGADIWWHSNPFSLTLQLLFTTCLVCFLRLSLFYISCNLKMLGFRPHFSAVSHSVICQQVKHVSLHISPFLLWGQVSLTNDLRGTDLLCGEFTKRGTQLCISCTACSIYCAEHAEHLSLSENPLNQMAVYKYVQHLQSQQWIYVQHGNCNHQHDEHDAVVMPVIRCVTAAKAHNMCCTGEAVHEFTLWALSVIITIVLIIPEPETWKFSHIDFIQCNKYF